MKSQTATTQRRGLRADLAPRIALLAWHWTSRAIRGLDVAQAITTRYRACNFADP